MDVVVVGGGIVGICTALYLRRAGMNVRVIERGQPGNEASAHNGGVFSIGNCIPTATPGVIRALPRMLRDPLSPLAIRWSYLPRLTPWLARFLLASRMSQVESTSIALQSLIDGAMDAYRPLIDGCEAQDLIRQDGLLYAYASAKGFADAEFEWRLRIRRGVAFEVVDDAAIARLDPALGGRFCHGIYLSAVPSTPDVSAFASALAHRLVDEGGEIQQAEVDGFQRSNGKVTSVLTSDGATAAESVVLAAGAWSRRLVRRLGYDIPLDTERGYGVDLPDPGITLRVPVISADYHFILTPTAVGVRLAGTDELAGLRAPPNFARADRLVDAARTFFPELRTNGATQWMNFRPSMPDSRPVIGPTPTAQNVYLAFGHGHIGLTLAAVTGKLVAEMIDGRPPSVPLEPFSARRFTRRMARPRDSRSMTT